MALAFLASRAYSPAVQPVRFTASQLKRRWALKPGVAFLNHGSFGACPRPILALQSHFRREMEAEPVQFLWRRYEDRLDPSRAVVARFLQARPRDIVFVPNATAGVNAVLRSFPLRKGDQVLTTNLDYNACRNVLADTAQRAGAELVVATVPFPIQRPDQVLDAVLSRVTRRTRLAMLDHVTSNTGLILPVAELTRELVRRGVEVLVDGAHAPGMVPLNLPRIGAAWYTGNLHKWVCAPKGAAFLWAREDRQRGLQPALISHGNNTPRPGYTPFQDRFDWTGTVDPSACFCAGAAIDWMERLLPGGWREIRERNRRLALAARRLLCERLRVDPPAPVSMIGSLVTLPLPEPFQGRPRQGKLDDEQLRLYDEFGIEVPFIRIEARRFFRISAQVYNSMPDYERLASALEECAVAAPSRPVGPR